MIMFTYINDNLDRLKYLVKIGIVSPSLLRYYGIYSRFDYYRKLGHDCHDAVVCTGLDFDIGESWVYKIIKSMEQEI
jgi:hypothetical protein